MGVTSINLRLGEGDVVIDGGDVTSFGQGVLPNFSGLQNGTLTLLQSAGGFLTFGATSNPLFVLLNHINAQAATATGSGISVAIDTSLFTAPVTANFNLNTVGNAGTHQSDSDDYVHGAREVFAIGYGDQTGSVGATTWNLNATGKNFVELFTHGSDTTTTVNMTGAGSLTLFGVSDEFDKVATINDKATGAQVITGALQTDGSSKSYTGFLTDNTALTSITVSSTNSGNFIDMSSFESVSGIAVSIGGGTLVLDDDVLIGLSSPLSLGTLTNIGYGGDDGFGPGIDGTIDMSFLPSSVGSLTFYHGVFDNTGTLSIINTKGTFTVNLQDEDFHSNNFNIAAATPAQGNTLTIDVGNAVTNQVATELDHHWNVTGCGTVDIVLAGDHFVDIADGGLDGGFVANSTVGPATINISGALGSATNIEFMFFGAAFNVTLDEFATFGSIASVAAFGVTTFAGSIVDTAKAELELGATDAILVDASKGAGLSMGDPDTNIGSTFVAIGSTNATNTLQSTFGLFAFTTNNNGGEFGFAGPATLTGGNKSDTFFDVGGAVTVNVHNTHSEIAYSQFQLNFGTDFAFAITNFAGNFDNNFIGTKALGPQLLVVNGFTPGDNGTTNFVDFNTDSWAFRKLPFLYEGLVNGVGEQILFQGSHFADFSIVTGTGGIFNTDVLAYEIGGPFGSAAAVAKALVSTGGFVDFGHSFVTFGFFDDFLVAYTNTKGGTSIADIQLAPVDHFDTEGATIRNAFDLVQLNKVAIGSIVGTALGSNDVIHFDFI
jgi:hypothetical protein